MLLKLALDLVALAGLGVALEGVRRVSLPLALILGGLLVFAGAFLAGRRE